MDTDTDTDTNTGRRLQLCRFVNERTGVDLHVAVDGNTTKQLISFVQSVKMERVTVVVIIIQGRSQTGAAAGKMIGGICGTEH